MLAITKIFITLKLSHLGETNLNADLMLGEKTLLIQHYRENRDQNWCSQCMEHIPPFFPLHLHNLNNPKRNHPHVMM
jgi:hypothetical protein